MYKNHIDVRLNHERFIKKICETQIVYALENEIGLANSSSNDLEDDEGEPVGIICFWSEKIRANVCAKNGWKDFKVLEINLTEFMEDYCVGIDNDGLLIGTNFDQNMFGYEIEGYDLVLEIIQELIQNNTELSFEKYTNLEDLKNQIESAIG